MDEWMDNRSDFGALGVKEKALTRNAKSDNAVPAERVKYPA